MSELENKLSAARAHEAELAKFRTRFSEIEPQLSDRESKLRLAHDELVGFKKRWVEHEGKFRAVDEENTRLKALLAEYEPKLKQAQQHDGELSRLRVRIGELEPRVHEWEVRYTKTVAQKDEELSQCRSRVAELDDRLSKLHTAPVAEAVHHHAPTKAERDDLKKIFGIGPVLEKRLNALGVYFFRDIANWTKEDIIRYEEHLKEFRDRIERDKWVEGARDEHFKKYGERLHKANAAKA